MTGRHSYRGLMSLPAYGLYADEKLLASCRAADAPAARDVFHQGDRCPSCGQLVPGPTHRANELLLCAEATLRVRLIG